MAIDFKTPEEVATEYLLHLKGLKPELNTDQVDNDWYIRSRVNGGVVSGIYADQLKISDDAFPQSARSEAQEKHLETYFNSGFLPAQPSAGDVLVSGTPGTTIEVGLEMTYTPNGNIYIVQEELELTAATGVVSVESLDAGQSQNLLAGASLSIASPPAGLENTATVLEENLSGGRNEETNAEAAARVLARIRNPISGGTATDYEQWAVEASASVTSAKAKRYPYGLGTMGVYFTAGTTDIDEAIDNGQPVLRLPSQDLIDTVEAYIDAKNPETDCLYMLDANEVEQDVTARVQLFEGYELSTILSGQTLTIAELIEREIGRALYKIPIGGREVGATGYVLASELEEALDQQLSTTPYAIGALAEVLVDRQIDDLSASGVNRMLLENEIVAPGTISVVLM